MKSNNAIFLLSILAIFILQFIFAWIGDDIFITFRVIDNFVNGHGLRWNIDERVQVYTHPLWMLIHIPIYHFTREVFYTVLFSSLFISLLSCILIFNKFRHNIIILVFCIFIPLSLSRAFIEYSSSGLENPITFLLISLSAIVILNKKESSIYALFFIIGLAALNRADTILIFIPLFIYLLYSEWHRLKIIKVLSVFVPIIAWFIFSFLYYGFLFPNTKYAKLNTGIEQLDLIKQGVNYLYVLIINDANSFVVICAGMLASIYLFFFDTLDKMGQRIKWFSFGLYAYVIYIILIGGDFMEGRFWSPMVLLSVIVISYTINLKEIDKQKFYGSIFAIFLVFSSSIGFVTRHQVIDSDPVSFVNKYGIADERSYYKSTNILWENIVGKADYRNFAWAVTGKNVKKEIETAGLDRRILGFFTAGMHGYFAGKKAFIIEPWGLTSALLARMPIINPKEWRIGHFTRETPAGYETAIRSGKLNEMDPHLAYYYSKLRFITMEPVFDLDRIATSIRFNFGEYDYFLQRYLEKRAQEKAL